MVANQSGFFAGKNHARLGNPYIIAEIGVNHEGSVSRAKNLIRLAKEGGAHAAKFQTYKADTLTVEDSPAYWDQGAEPTATQHGLFSKYDSFDEADYVELATYCEKVGIDFLSTPFDSDAVDFLDPLVPFFKVASADITNLLLLQKIGMTGKPVVLSTGASNLDEISRAISTIHAAGSADIALLHCILSYPTPNEHANLQMLTSLKENFPDYVIGYSDHTAHDQRGFPSLVAHLAGAQIIEKHFTDDKSSQGNDHYHAMDSADLMWLTQSLLDVKLLLGDATVKKSVPIEDSARIGARRSLVTLEPLDAGTSIAEASLTAKRPGHGISPFDIDRVVGMQVRRHIPKNSILVWGDLV